MKDVDKPGDSKPVTAQRVKQLAGGQNCELPASNPRPAET